MGRSEWHSLDVGAAGGSKEGVGVFVNKELYRSLIGQEGVSSRILRVKFKFAKARCM